MGSWKTGWPCCTAMAARGTFCRSRAASSWGVLVSAAECRYVYVALERLPKPRPTEDEIDVSRMERVWKASETLAPLGNDATAVSHEATCSLRAGNTDG